MKMNMATEARRHGDTEKMRKKETRKKKKKL